MDTPAKTAEDLIGIVPHTLGYVPHRSLVAIIVVTDESGVRTCETTLRVDFDLETAAHIVSEGGDWFAQLITGACPATGVFLVLYDDEFLPACADDRRGSLGLDGGGLDGGGLDLESLDLDSLGLDSLGLDSLDLDGGDLDLDSGGLDLDDDEYGRVHRGLVRASVDELATALGEQGIDTLGAWWVSEDLFGRIDDEADPGTSLEEASASACATELVAGGSSPVAEAQELVVRPISAAEFAAGREGRTDAWLSIDDSFDLLTLIYPQLTDQRRTAAALDRQTLDDLMTLPVVMAIDSILSEKWSRDALEMILSFDHPNFRPCDLMGCLPGELTDRALRYSRSRQAAQEMVGLSSRPPRPSDIKLSIELLRRYVRVGHPEVRATAYAVIAWFEWSLGGSTMAELYARAALDLDPNHAMAGLIISAVENGYLPQWLMGAGRGPVRSNSPSRE